MAEEPRAMTQEEIDELFANLSTSMPAIPKVLKNAPPPEEEKPAEEAQPTGPLDQDEIDAVLKNMEGSSAKEPAVQAQAEPEGPLGQDDIDALLAEMNGEESSTEEPAAQAQAEPEGPLGQDDIDALLAEMNGEESSTEEPAAQAQAEPEGPLGQDDIDALLAEMNGEDAASPEKSEPEGPLGQDDIDALLAEMSGAVDSIDDGQQKTEAVNETARVNSDLSAEEIDSLVAKQEQSDEDSEALIDQNDIDALVRQMSEATSPPDAEHVTDMLQKRGGDIEALLNEAAKNVDTSDAISEIASFDSATPSGEKVVYGPPINAMAPEELRGTRFLLAAAVFLLAMCTAAMVFVVSSINRLSGELHANRETVTTPSDDYSEDLQIASDMLAYDDPVESQKGVVFLKRVRNRHRDVNKEIEVTLILARHFLANGRADEAVLEYATVADRLGGLANDPTFYLEWATAHDAMNANAEAQRIAGILLANEEYFLTNSNGEPLAEETYNRHQRIIRQAHLLMGRIALAQGQTALSGAKISEHRDSAQAEAIPQ